MGDRNARIGVLIDSAPWTRAIPGAAALARRAARAALAAATAEPGEVAVVLSDDATVKRLNRDYRRNDKPTNVLSFPLADAKIAPCRLLGDVILARETVLAEAEAEGKRPGDHLSHLVVHGVLHLLGFDHGKDADARRMAALERRILAGLGIADPYRRARLAAARRPKRVAA